ncbi:uncharacterized protein BDW43DRAFT_310353 [Aspergillus alliaceus]|uniref:uncharacterized protein n=1 Tax=Petromyces alliaceus TaxID=209559 RepID=UPI0012A60A06|nr:uncharacterized protein BDW43DRAFT_310353 [Aspergillus alliaceus]KAB8234329.1 hypothetical protein BDW43DRAFT_310353 [Aspergillus alliaceus]
MQSAHPRMDHYRSNTESEPPTEYMDLIEKYLLVVPHLTPYKPDSVDLLQPTLWHGSLHLNNIYVDLSTETITDIVDYQNTTVNLLLLQAKIPRMADISVRRSVGLCQKSQRITSRKEFAQRNMENREYIEGLMEESQGSGILPSDGIVDTDDYDIVQKTNYMKKEKFLLAETEE